MNEELTFEEIFKPLIDECRKIDIEYDYKMYGFQDDGYAVYEIVRINGEYPFKFRKRVLELGKEGIESLRKELNRISYEGRVDFLEDIKAEVLSLGSIVRDDEIVYEETADSHRKEVQFKSFKTANLIAVSDERNRGHELSILYKASEYAVAYQGVINEIASKVDFLIHHFELLPETKAAIKDKSTIHIFYSWQSDIEAENKAIRKSLEKLIPHFRKSEKKIKIDSDMRGTTGSVDITNTLFQKIDMCDIFVADINIVGQSLHRKSIFSPNANVLIELGYAVSKISWDRVILLFNSAVYTIEQLPFDIRQRSIVWYKDQQQLQEKLKFAINELLKKEKNS
jgi:hypothetical protein